MEKVIIQQDKKMLMVLMITIALDFMGFLLVFPLFPDLFIAKTSVLVPVSASLTMRYFYYALALATWPVGCFLERLILARFPIAWVENALYYYVLRWCHFRMRCKPWRFISQHSRCFS